MIYHASDEEKARLAQNRITEKWTAKYQNPMKRWYDNWEAITPIFKLSPDVRKVITQPILPTFKRKEIAYEKI